jgi:hypothetical protein
MLNGLASGEPQPLANLNLGGKCGRANLTSGRDALSRSTSVRPYGPYGTSVRLCTPSVNLGAALRGAALRSTSVHDTIFPNQDGRAGRHRDDISTSRDVRDRARQESIAAHQRVADIVVATAAHVPRVPLPQQD